MNSLLWQGVWYRRNAQENVTASVKTGEIENCPVSENPNMFTVDLIYKKKKNKKKQKKKYVNVPEFPEVCISKNSSENGSKVAEH